MEGNPPLVLATYPMHILISFIPYLKLKSHISIQLPVMGGQHLAGLMNACASNIITATTPIKVRLFDLLWKEYTVGVGDMVKAARLFTAAQRR
jgi:hypothetical protein